MKLLINDWYCDQKAGRQLLQRPVTYLILGEIFKQFVGQDIPELGVSILEKSERSCTGYWPEEDWRLYAYKLKAPNNLQTVYIFTDPLTKEWIDKPKTLTDAINHKTFHHVRIDIASAIIRDQFPKYAEVEQCSY